MLTVTILLISALLPSSLTQTTVPTGQGPDLMNTLLGLPPGGTVTQTTTPAAEIEATPPPAAPSTTAGGTSGTGTGTTQGSWSGTGFGTVSGTASGSGTISGQTPTSSYSAMTYLQDLLKTMPRFDIADVPKVLAQLQQRKAELAAQGKTLTQQDIGNILAAFQAAKYGSTVPVSYGSGSTYYGSQPTAAGMPSTYGSGYYSSLSQLSPSSTPIGTNSLSEYGTSGTSSGTSGSPTSPSGMSPYEMMQSMMATGKMPSSMSTLFNSMMQSQTVAGGSSPTSGGTSAGGSTYPSGSTSGSTYSSGSTSGSTYPSGPTYPSGSTSTSGQSSSYGPLSGSLTGSQPQSPTGTLPQSQFGQPGGTYPFGTQTQGQTSSGTSYPFSQPTSLLSQPSGPTSGTATNQIGTSGTGGMATPGGMYNWQLEAARDALLRRGSQSYSYPSSYDPMTSGILATGGRGSMTYQQYYPSPSTIDMQRLQLLQQLRNRMTVQQPYSLQQPQLLTSMQNSVYPQMSSGTSSLYNSMQRNTVSGTPTENSLARLSSALSQLSAPSPAVANDINNLINQVLTPPFAPKAPSANSASNADLMSILLGGTGASQGTSNSVLPGGGSPSLYNQLGGAGGRMLMDTGAGGKGEGSGMNLLDSIYGGNTMRGMGGAMNGMNGGSNFIRTPTLPTRPSQPNPMQMMLPALVMSSGMEAGPMMALMAMNGGMGMGGGGGEGGFAGMMTNPLFLASMLGGELFSV